MRIIKDAKDMQKFSLAAKARGKSIAFVPTMGALHEGHLSLIEAARKKGELLVVSIFINPAQFGPNEDFHRYPRDPKGDRKALENYNVDVLFLPDHNKMYPAGYRTFVEVEELSKKMCGRSRPTHFKGVTTILTKLFNLVMPDFVFFGEKDFQQLLITKNLTKDLNYPLEVIGMPIVRDFDGLALSSRNKALNEKERKSATILYKALSFAKSEIENSERDLARLLMRVRSMIGTEPCVRLDYVVMVDPNTLEDIKSIKGDILIALAASIGPTRLIDNIRIKV
jgi:pantoate--beta-alanine ligase